MGSLKEAPSIDGVPALIASVYRQYESFRRRRLLIWEHGGPISYALSDANQRYGSDSKRWLWSPGQLGEYFEFPSNLIFLGYANLTGQRMEERTTTVRDRFHRWSNVRAFVTVRTHHCNYTSVIKIKRTCLGERREYDLLWLRFISISFAVTVTELLTYCNCNWASYLLHCNFWSVLLRLVVLSGEFHFGYFPSSRIPPSQRVEYRKLISISSK